MTPPANRPASTPPENSTAPSRGLSDSSSSSAPAASRRRPIAPGTGPLCITAQFADHRDGQPGRRSAQCRYGALRMGRSRAVRALDDGRTAERYRAPRVGQSPRSPLFARARPAPSVSSWCGPQSSARPDLFVVESLPCVSGSGDPVLACAEPGKLLEVVRRSARRAGRRLRMAIRLRSSFVLVWCDWDVTLSGQRGAPEPAHCFPEVVFEFGLDEIWIPGRGLWTGGTFDVPDKGAVLVVAWSLVSTTPRCAALTMRALGIGRVLAEQLEQDGPTDGGVVELLGAGRRRGPPRARSRMRGPGRRGGLGPGDAREPAARAARRAVSRGEARGRRSPCSS